MKCQKQVWVKQLVIEGSRMWRQACLPPAWAAKSPKKNTMKYKNPFTDPEALLRRHALHKAEEDLFAFSEQPLPSSFLLLFPPPLYAPFFCFSHCCTQEEKKDFCWPVLESFRWAEEQRYIPKRGGGGAQKSGARGILSASTHTRNCAVSSSSLLSPKRHAVWGAQYLPYCTGEEVWLCVVDKRKTQNYHVIEREVQLWCQLL